MLLFCVDSCCMELCRGMGDVHVIIQHLLIIMLSLYNYDISPLLFECCIHVGNVQIICSRSSDMSGR